MRLGFKQAPVQLPQRQVSRTRSVAAPTRGLYTSANLSDMPRQSALVLDNFFPTENSIKIRGGITRHAYIGAFACESMIRYAAGAVEEIFACGNGSIFPISSPADPNVAPTADVTGKNGDYYSYIQVANAAGTEFVLACNGADHPINYNGTTWDTTPAITGTGLTPADLNAPWLYANRVWFTEKDTLSAWYLSVNAIGGTATEFSLNSVFQKGGSLLAGGTWSSDSGAGQDDRCVFITARGEIAVYAGTDPSSASTFELVGVYEVAEPKGRNCLMKAGGDLVIGTADGLVPLTEVLRKDTAALSLSAVSRPIQDQWVENAQLRRTLPWEIIKYDDQNRAYCLMPDDGQDPRMFVVNLETGAWCRYTGWDMRCGIVFNKDVYFGDKNGRIYKGESGGLDDTEIYVAIYVNRPEHFNLPAVTKTLFSVRSTFRTTRDFNFKLSASKDYTVSLPAAPDVTVVDELGDVWDTAEWDVGKWAAPRSSIVKTRWSSVGRTGFVFMPQCQISSGTVSQPDAELITMDAVFQPGAVMV